jgi:hypothetical protein
MCRSDLERAGNRTRLAPPACRECSCYHHHGATPRDPAPQTQEHTPLKVPDQPLDHSPGAPVSTMSPKRCFHRSNDIEDAAIANPTCGFRFSPKDKNREREK